MTAFNGLQYYNYGAQFALVTIGCLSAYSMFTFGVTQRRWVVVSVDICLLRVLMIPCSIAIRRAMNQAENESGARSVDSLLNYETVKVGA